MLRLWKVLLASFLIAFVFWSLDACKGASRQSSEIVIFAASITRPVIEELSSIYEQDTGNKPILIFGGSGAVLSQMKLARYGDLYLSASHDFMDKAKTEGLILPETEIKLAYLIPAINVQKGNPKGIKGLQDLGRAGLKVAIANPKTVVIGLLAQEIMKKNGLSAKIEPNIVVYAESAEKLQSLLALKTVDAVIGWRDFQNWAPQYIDSILIGPQQLTRISYVAAAISSFTSNKSQAREFLSFMTSEKAIQVFKNKGYIISEGEALKYIKNKK